MKVLQKKNQNKREAQASILLLPKAVCVLLGRIEYGVPLIINFEELLLCCLGAWIRSLIDSHLLLLLLLQRRIDFEKEEPIAHPKPSNGDRWIPSYCSRAVLVSASRIYYVFLNSIIIPKLNQLNPSSLTHTLAIRKSQQLETELRQLLAKKKSIFDKNAIALRNRYFDLGFLLLIL